MGGTGKGLKLVLRAADAEQSTSSLDDSVKAFPLTFAFHSLAVFPKNFH